MSINPPAKPKPTVPTIPEDDGTTKASEAVNMEFDEQVLLGDEPLDKVEEFTRSATTALFGEETSNLSKDKAKLTDHLQGEWAERGSATCLGQIAVLRMIAKVEAKLEKHSAMLSELKREVSSIHTMEATKQAEDKSWRQRLSNDIEFAIQQNADPKQVQSSSSSFTRKRHSDRFHDRPPKERKTESSFVAKFTCALCLSNAHQTIACTTYSSTEQRRERSRELHLCTECSHVHPPPCRADIRRKLVCPLCSGHHPSWLCRYVLQGAPANPGQPSQ